MKGSTREVLNEELSQGEYPDFQPGDKIRVETREDIGGHMRTRFFEGVCIARKGEGIDQTFKVRKDSFGVGVERIFPLHSPIIESIRVLRKGVVRRAKLNYLAEKSSRDARIEERRADLDAINRVQSGSVEEEETFEEEIVEEANEETAEAPEVADETEQEEAGTEPVEEGAETAEDSEEAETEEEEEEAKEE